MIKEMIQVFFAGILLLFGGKVEDPFVSGNHINTSTDEETDNEVINE